jgi:hypothetical protein
MRAPATSLGGQAFNKGDGLRGEDLGCALAGIAAATDETLACPNRGRVTLGLYSGRIEHVLGQTVLEIFVF